jgi:hypothetical protein
MSTTKTQGGVTKIGTAAAKPSATTISLNGEVPLSYRIGTTDRSVMEFSDSPDGFLVFNQTNGNVFQSVQVASTTITSGLSATDTTVHLTSGTSFPVGSTNAFIQIENEVMNVTQKSGNTLTVVRGQRNTTATSHASGTTAVYKIWTSWGSIGNIDAVDPTLIDRWFNSTPTNPLRSRQSPDAGPGPGIAYRIGSSDRQIGASADGAPDGFLVLNSTNGKVFVVSGGLWAAAGIFPEDLYEAWLEEWIPTGFSVTSKTQTGLSRVRQRVQRTQTGKTKVS